MRTGHLFAGAGGGIYADLILGHEPVFAVEWDNYAAGVLQRRIDDGWFAGMHLHHQDVTLFDPSKYKGRIHSLHAGFPCTDISVAGNGAGIEGEQSGLWREVVRVAGELGCREIFLENSPAITGRGLGKVLGDLAILGFDARWCVLPASAVGAPHIRARWWCLARLPNSNSNGAPLRGHSWNYEESVGGGESHLGGGGGYCGKRCAPKPGEDPGDDANVCEDVPDADGSGQQRQRRIRNAVNQEEGREREAGYAINECVGEHWRVEPGMGRVVNGMANRFNRIKCLGNGQVPLQAAAAYILLDNLFQ